MDLYPLPGAPRPGPVDAGWVRAVHRGPRTVEEVLQRAREAMDAEDEAEAYRADPLLWVRAQRRRTLLGRLLYGRRR